MYWIWIIGRSRVGCVNVQNPGCLQGTKMVGVFCLGCSNFGCYSGQLRRDFGFAFSKPEMIWGCSGFDGVSWASPGMPWRRDHVKTRQTSNWRQLRISCLSKQPVSWTSAIGSKGWSIKWSEPDGVGANVGNSIELCSSPSVEGYTSALGRTFRCSEACNS